MTLDAEDLPAVAAVMRRYQDAGLQLADAALVHLAEREGIRTVFTTDRRDFSIIRLKRNRTLRLIPDLH
jgi:predicted nucleic acid-binding protein